MPIRIAFLVLAHSDAAHLARLCRVLQPHSVFVHLDRKSTGMKIDELTELPGVTFVEPSVAVHWGDVSVLHATLALIRKAHQTGSFDRFVLLSGACYPIKPLKIMEEAFARDPSREWIALTKITPNSHHNAAIGRRWRMAPLLDSPMDKTLRTLWNKVTKTLRRDLPREIGMTPYFGSQWWALSRDCIATILSVTDARPQLLKAYASVYAPDEHFFHTIIGNSKFQQYAIAVEDQGSATNQAAPLHLIAPAEDRYFTGGDAEFALIQSSSKFFLRKVSTARTTPLLDRIDHELLERQSASPVAS